MILRKLLGQVMIDMGFATQRQLEIALQRQRRIFEEKILPERVQRPSIVSEARLARETTPLLGQVLIDMGFASKGQLDNALREQEKIVDLYKPLFNEKVGAAVEIGSLVNSTLNLSEVLALIMGHANRVTNSAASTLALIDDTTGELVFSVPTGPKADKLIDIRLPSGKGIAGWVAEHEQTVMIPDVRKDPRFYPQIDEISGFETKSILCVPLKAKTKLIGVLETINKADGISFTEEDAMLLSIFACQAAIAIENARLYGELKESEEKYRRLVENANDAIFIVQDEVVKFPNPKAEEMIGYCAEELAKISFVDLIHPENKDMVADRHKGILNGEELPSTYSFRIINRTGEELWGQINTVLITWEGRPATLNLLRDITQQKRLESQLQRAQKMETIGTLAGGVAHDLNNILSGLVSYPELILLEIPEDSPLRQSLLTIQKSGEKATAVVQDLLTLARRGVTVAEVVNLNLIISEYMKSPEYEKLISFHPNVQARTNLEADLLNILGSPAHLSKTVMNLVSNAAEAISEGGIISISTQNRYIDKPIGGYDHVEEGDYAMLTVSDAGVGISPTDMERIFEPFYSKKVMGRSGTGLGMAVVWGTVKDHRGYIDVQSTEGKGTTFCLYFPVTRKELAKDKSLLSIEDYMGKGESVLVVDDVQEQREIASKILKKLGYSVTTVSSGEEAVDYLKDNTADLLILDMIMDPGIDGLDTYKKIIELHPKQKAIIASGLSETERVKEAQKLGAGAYVKKPFLLEKIGLAVREELER